MNGSDSKALVSSANADSNARGFVDTFKGLCAG